MKKFLNIFIALIAVFFILTPVFAQETEKIAVFAVDIKDRNSNYMYYSNTLYMITSDVINELNKKPFINTLDLSYSESLIDAHKLTPEYKNFIKEFKNSYIIDYDTCSLIAQKLGVDKILLVSGDFDLENMVFQKGLLRRLEIIGIQDLKPSYKMTMYFTLIDPQNNSVILEKTYKKFVDVDYFQSPFVQYNNYVVSIDKMKQLSNGIAKSISTKIATKVNPITTTTTVKSNIIKEDASNDMSEVPVNEFNSINSKDGSLTKDGLLNSENKSDYFLEKRKENFKNWIKIRLP